MISIQSASESVSAWERVVAFISFLIALIRLTCEEECGSVIMRT